MVLSTCDLGVSGTWSHFSQKNRLSGCLKCDWEQKCSTWNIFRPITDNLIDRVPLISDSQSHTTADRVVVVCGTMDLNTLCALLQRNDPSVTAVGEEEQYDDMGFHRIGEALVQGSNTHVSYIALGLSRLLPAEPLPNLEAISATGDHDGVATETVEDRLFCHGAKCAGPLLRFVRESAVLSKLCLWSEYESSVNSRLLGLFFKALLDNQQADLLEELVIGQCVFTEQSSELLGAPSLSQTMSITMLGSEKRSSPTPAWNI
jgi:hypothetical protein